MASKLLIFNDAAEKDASDRAAKDSKKTFSRHTAPARPKEELEGEMLLDSPEARREAVRKVALYLTEPGDEVTDRQIVEAFKNDGKRLVADNPAATVSTILNGFKSEFEKVAGRRSVFRRRSN